MENAAAPMMPRAHPIAAMSIPCPVMVRRTDEDVAPIAMRTPISRVRKATLRMHRHRLFDDAAVEQMYLTLGV